LTTHSVNAGGLPERPAGIYRHALPGIISTVAAIRNLFSDALLNVMPGIPEIAPTEGCQNLSDVFLKKGASHVFKTASLSFFFYWFPLRFLPVWR
jgi:hypothetical protein